MNQFEYLIPFVGIIYALSATDLLVSIHRLIIERKVIRFHAVPIVWAAVAFLLVINGWWGFLQVNEKIRLENAGQLFLLSLLPLMVFLVAALSLPHKADHPVSLWEYFCEHKRPLYICHMAYALLTPLILGSFGDQINTTALVRSLVLAGMFFALLWLKHWVWHLLVGALFTAMLLGALFQQSMV